MSNFKIISIEKLKFYIIFISLLSNSFLLKSQTNDSSLIINVPVLDLPFQQTVYKTYYNIGSFAVNPSMKQSLYWSNSFYTLSRYYIKKHLKKDYAIISTLLFDFLSYYVPFGISWLHEEYHRAVLTRWEAKSYNDVNKFPFFRQFIYVSKVKDEDLSRIANNHNADFRRLNTAGIESQMLQIRKLQQNNFFYNKTVNFDILYITSIINSVFYINSCSKIKTDEAINKILLKEGTDISRRDMTGLDFTAWADALYYPDKPYESRGIHPSGVGINRYVKVSDLSPQARRYLKNQSYLNALNLVSPAIFGVQHIKLKQNIYSNYSLRHFLTPFGNNISLDIFLKSSKANLFFSIHTFSNKEKTFGGFETYWLNVPIKSNSLLVSLRSFIWYQPSTLSFYDKSGKLGGMVNIELSYNKAKFFIPYVELEYKTKGWLAGNVYLNDNFNINSGLKFKIR